MARRQLSTALAGLSPPSLPHLSIKGGAFTLIDSAGNEKPIETRHFDCVMIDMQVPAEGGARTERVFWGLDDKGQPKGYDEGAATPPVCFSDNGIGASINAPEPQSSSCNACPMNRFDWVSKRDLTKRTKACNVIKKIALIPMAQIDKTAEWEPIHEAAFLFRVPIMSHKNLQSYGDKFKGQNFDLTQVITRVSFVHGEVGLLQFEGVAKIDADTEVLVEQIMSTGATDALVGRGDKPVQQVLPAPQAGQAQQVLPAPQTAPPAPAPLSPFEQQAAPASTPPAKRGRKPKTEAPSPLTPFGQQAVPQDDSIPPFLRREAAPPAQTAQGSGIAQNAPAPPVELEAALDALFKLPV